jgi:hypothetical protein
MVSLRIQFLLLIFALKDFNMVTDFWNLRIKKKGKARPVTGRESQ